jgi:hypothetical protein
VTSFYREARWRARRRKSAWNILLFALCFGSWAALWYVLFQLVWAFHVNIHPDHQLREFWSPGISPGSFVLSFLMMFAPVPGAVALGFMLGNILIWLIPPARRVLDAEARGYPGTSFVQSMRGLFKISCWTLPIGIAVSLAAAYSLNSLR